ncbi:hypothetical protein JFU50_21495 [Peribacillus sp. TH14]|nr:hypothetical protein [Peribacillus sp. TH14]
MNYSDKKILVEFLNYLKGIVETKYKFKFTLNKLELNKRDEKEVYEFEKFLNYYKYVKDYNLHIEKAISNRDYAITWLYITIHLTNAWRHGDVIRLPKINISEMGITTFAYFKDKNLSFEQASKILAQVDKTKMVRQIISKTRLNRTLNANQSLVVSLATAYAISQLHSDIEQDTLLINFKTKFNIPYDKPFNLFFGKNSELLDFSSLKMNRSFVEHLYYSIYKKGGKAYTAYQKATKARSHKLSPNQLYAEITQTYINQYNEEAPIDDIAVELFERGEFGYLYYLILEGTKDEQGQELSLMDQTELIKQFKSRYSPIEVEGLAKFIRERQTNDASLAFEIIKQPKENLNEILDKMYLGQMPSRDKNYHCLSYPKCHRVESVSCSHCPIAIPRAGALQSLKDEIEAKITALLNANSLGNVLRDLPILNALLNRLAEAAKDLGNGYVNEFIDLKKLGARLTSAKERAESIKRLIEEG